MAKLLEITIKYTVLENQQKPMEWNGTGLQTSRTQDDLALHARAHAHH